MHHYIWSIVKYLINKRLDINDKNYFGYSSLVLASQYGYLHIVKYLVENGALQL